MFICATHTQMEEHEKALSLLVHKLRDYPMAQEYCEEYSKGKGRVYRQNLYQTLLRVYLQPQDRSACVCVCVCVSGWMGE
jgi:hypothetical protein